MNRKIILASQSERRYELLMQLDIPFRVEVSGVDEASAKHLPVKEMVQTLARNKAEVIAAKHQNAIVIGADTMVSIEDEVIGKPTDAAD
jgi:septum formation protein